MLLIGGELSISNISLRCEVKAVEYIYFIKKNGLWISWASQVTLVIKNSPANAGDAGSVPGLGRVPGGGHGNPLQYSCLGNPMDREAWQAAVYGVAKCWTQLKQLSTMNSLLLLSRFSRVRLCATPWRQHIDKNMPTFQGHQGAIYFSSVILQYSK